MTPEIEKAPRTLRTSLAERTDVNTKRSLRKYLINPRFQLSMLAYFAVISLVTILAIYISTRMAWNSLATSPLLTRLVGDQFLQALLAEQRSTLTSIFVIASVEALLILMISGMIISHQVAGPIYRIRKSLDKIADGHYPKPVTFRKHDYFLEVEESFNRAIKRVIESGLPPKPPAKPESKSPESPDHL
ncbi:MAG TPA: hypothetical protein DCS07_03935 [Bdellovibrionales bacterium]|nr:MAG: hypothetical protein A2Z97_12580 [Bdellovibrionales bacterium GWB1_52_6]OFZ04158.1 MAG: hypothetical protein A2X97_15280 [Bdellovibrionales bacterium GWA1_52_35]OFZ33288.1 MAG: hypothetical protein A2070_14650 [Bdellovibrionales bacterium GWC1_52_8]HAR41768.1 hypothetical protein [Bdellovibrionales bacterium]HCM40500.1 hypothetical protein [Bdellovibrionales bacterium]